MGNFINFWAPLAAENSDAIGLWGLGGAYLIFVTIFQFAEKRTTAHFSTWKDLLSGEKWTGYLRGKRPKVFALGALGLTFLLWAPYRADQKAKLEKYVAEERFNRATGDLKLANADLRKKLASISDGSGEKKKLRDWLAGEIEGGYSAIVTAVQSGDIEKGMGIYNDWLAKVEDGLGKNLGRSYVVSFRWCKPKNYQKPEHIPNAITSSSSTLRNLFLQRIECLKEFMNEFK